MSTSEIAGHLLERYGIEVSSDLVSAVTDVVLNEIATWHARSLEPPRITRRSGQGCA